MKSRTSQAGKNSLWALADALFRKDGDYSPEDTGLGKGLHSFEITRLTRHQACQKEAGKKSGLGDERESSVMSSEEVGLWVSSWGQDVLHLLSKCLTTGHQSKKPC